MLHMGIDDRQYRVMRHMIVLNDIGLRPNPSPAFGEENSVAVFPMKKDNSVTLMSRAARMLRIQRTVP